MLYASFKWWTDRELNPDSLRAKQQCYRYHYRPIKIHSQALSIALSKQTRQRYLCLLSSTNLPFGWWTLTDRRPTNSLMELLFPELKAHYRQMLDSKCSQSRYRPCLTRVNSSVPTLASPLGINQTKTRLAIHLLCLEPPRRLSQLAVVCCYESLKNGSAGWLCPSDLLVMSQVS